MIWNGLLVIYILFVPFYKGQLVDGYREIVGSPEEAFLKIKEIDGWSTMPNGSKYAQLFKVDLTNKTVEEIEIPKSITVTR